MSGREYSIIRRVPSAAASHIHSLSTMTRSTLILHCLWFLVATAAFLVGAQRSQRQNGALGPEDAFSTQESGNSPSQLAGQSPGEAKKNSQRHRPDTGAAGSMFSSAGLANASIADLAKAAASSSPVKRSQAVALLLDKLDTENAPEILGQAHEAGASEEHMGLLVYAWGALDGTAAMAFADEIAEHMNDEERFGYRSQVVKGWASSDPAQAKAWVDGLENQKGLVDDLEEAQDMLAGYRWNLIAGMADGSIYAATAYAFERAEANDRGAPRYMDMITERQLEQSNIGDSVDWAEALPEGHLKTAALRRIATDYVDENPGGAADWAETMIDQDHGPRVIHEVSDEWAERDPAAAVAWLETLQDGEAKSAGMSAALAEWVKRGDPMEASKYLANMPQSPERDQAVGGFAEILARSDPQSAVQWAETIQREDVREEALVEAGRAWMRRDPIAAAQWLQDGTVGSQTAEKIIAGSKDRDWGER